MPLEPRALKFPKPRQDREGLARRTAKMGLLESTHCPEQVDSSAHAAIYCTGGHAVMYDFLDDEGLQRRSVRRNADADRHLL